MAVKSSRNISDGLINFKNEFNSHNNIFKTKYIEFDSILDYLNKLNSIPLKRSNSVFKSTHSIDDSSVLQEKNIYLKNYNEIGTSILSEKEFLHSITKKILSRKELNKFWKLKRKELSKEEVIYYYYFEILNKVYFIHSSREKEYKLIYRFIEIKFPLFRKKYGLRVKLLTNELARIY